MKGRNQPCQRGALNRMRAFSFFCPKKFSSIYRFLWVTHVKGRCQQGQRGALNSVRALVFRSKNFFFHISISEGCRGKTEVSTVPTRCSKQCASIFVFLSKNFFDISISVGRTGKREVSTMPTWCPEQCASIFVFRSKKFFFDI